MKTSTFAFFFVLVPSVAMADSSVVKFRGGIGADPVGGIAASGMPVSNVVCNLPPGGLPWRIGRLDAKVLSDGHITVQGEGLLLSGGNTAFPSAIGATGGIASVQAELFCNTTASSCGTASTSGFVPLELNGDFDINTTLSPPVPQHCTNPVLLIVPNGTPRWFAAGIPASGE